MHKLFSLIVTEHRIISNINKKKDSAVFISFLTSLQNGTATFQVAIAASETEAYAVVTYKQKEMNWAYRPVEQPPIDVGFTDVDKTDHKCQDHVLSRTRKVLHLDEVRGNTGKKKRLIIVSIVKLMMKMITMNVSLAKQKPTDTV